MEIFWMAYLTVGAVTATAGVTLMSKRRKMTRTSMAKVVPLVVAFWLPMVAALIVTGSLED